MSRGAFCGPLVVCFVLLGCSEPPVLAPPVNNAATDEKSAEVPGTKFAGPEVPDGLNEGHRLMAAGDYNAALDAYSRAASEQGLTVDVLSALGSANLKLGRLGQAEEFLERAVARDNSFAPAWNNLGVVLSSLNRPIDARQAFEAAFANDNGLSEEIWQNLLLAIEIQKSSAEEPEPEAAFQLIRRGNGRFLLLETPK